jgi:uncharacterized iron-regulated membrane protein
VVFSKGPDADVVAAGGKGAVSLPLEVGMSMLRWSIFFHKWLGLVVGLQVLGWVLGGIVMTVIPIERVRSEHHYAAYQPAPLPAAGVLDLQGAMRAAGVEAVEATIKTTLRGAVWVLKDGAGKSHVVDAITGRHMPPLTASEARLLAGAVYQGKGRPGAARFYRQAPQEAGKAGPLWRVDFDDAEGTAFYLSPETGEVVSKRSKVWRLYDVFWRIHILDFRAGDDFNNPLIIAAAVLSLPMVIAGIIILLIRLARDLNAALRTRRAARAQP